MKNTMIEIYYSLKPLIGEKEAKSLVEYLEIRSGRNLLRWMFLFWISQVAIIVTAFLLFMR